MSSSPTNASNANQKSFDNDSTGIQTSQSKRTRWGTTAFPIPTTTMSLDEEITYNASKQNDDPSSIISPSGNSSMESKGSWFHWNEWSIYTYNTLTEFLFYIATKFYLKITVRIPPSRLERL